jgi:hypothetical protein
MSTLSPVAQQAFRELKAANGELLRAMARQKRARATLAKAEGDVAEAKRKVELLLMAVQPELPDAGILDTASAGEAEQSLLST